MVPIGFRFDSKDKHPVCMRKSVASSTYLDAHAQKRLAFESNLSAPTLILPNCNCYRLVINLGFMGRKDRVNIDTILNKKFNPNLFENSSFVMYWIEKIVQFFQFKVLSLPDY